MPSLKIKTAKRKSTTTTKAVTRVKAKRVTKKRPARAASRKRIKKAEIETVVKPLNVTYLADLPSAPEPEAIIPTPVAAPVEVPAHVEPEHQVDEVKPVVSQTTLSIFRSRLSFYMGVLAGAAVLHVLVFAVAMIVLS